jgi:hypothetical protein
MGFWHGCGSGSLDLFPTITGTDPALDQGPDSTLDPTFISQVKIWACLFMMYRQHKFFNAPDWKIQYF